MNVRKAVMVVGAVMVVLVAVFVVSRYRQTHRPYTASDETRIRSVVGTVRQARAISDEDLDWTVSVLKSSSTPPLPKSIILATYAIIENPTREQHERMFQATLKVASNNDDENQNLGEVSAASTLGKLGDPRAVPILTNLSGHPNPAVQAAASRALKRLENPAPVGAAS